MSVLTDSNQYASSSRVKGIFKYLLQKDGHKESRDKLEKMLSPDSLIRGDEDNEKTRDMIKGTINECIKMNLIVENRESGDISLSPKFPVNLTSKRKGVALLPLILTRLMITTENDANNHLSQITSWLLTQDVYLPLGSKWADMEPALRQQVGSDLLGMNDARYSQFVDWVCFLGFAWRLNLKEKDLITPDPTAYMRSSINTIIDPRGEDALPLGDFINSLATLCPVFETGVFRVEVENRVSTRASPHHLSSTTAFALLRLYDEKIIELLKRSDAPVYIFPDGDHLQYYSHIKPGKKFKENGLAI